MSEDWENMSDEQYQRQKERRRQMGRFFRIAIWFVFISLCVCVAIGVTGMAL